MPGPSTWVARSQNMMAPYCDLFGVSLMGQACSGQNQDTGVLGTVLDIHLPRSRAWPCQGAAWLPAQHL